MAEINVLILMNIDIALLDVKLNCLLSKSNKLYSPWCLICERINESDINGKWICHSWFIRQRAHVIQHKVGWMKIWSFWEFSSRGKFPTINGNIFVLPRKNLSYLPVFLRIRNKYCLFPTRSSCSPPRLTAILVKFRLPVKGAVSLFGFISTATHARYKF